MDLVPLMMEKGYRATGCTYAARASHSHVHLRAICEVLSREMTHCGVPGIRVLRSSGYIMNEQGWV